MNGNWKTTTQEAGVGNSKIIASFASAAGSKIILHEGGVGFHVSYSKEKELEDFTLFTESKAEAFHQYNLVQMN